MKKQKMTKYEKRLIMANIYYYVLIEYNKPKGRYNVGTRTYRGSKIHTKKIHQISNSNARTSAIKK